MKLVVKTGVLALMVWVSLDSFAETRTIDLLPGEYWWDATVSMDGMGHSLPHVPHGADAAHVTDLRVAGNGNPASPLLMSTKGRWVWCEDAFKYTFSEGRLTVETGPAPRRDGTEPDPNDIVAMSSGHPSERRAAAAKTVIPNVEKTCYSKRNRAKKG